MFAPDSVTVAAPFFTRPPPPETVPLRPTSALPTSVSVVPVATLTLFASDTLAIASSDDEPLTFTAPMPSAVLLPTARLPPFRFVPPVYTFVPVSVCVPLPESVMPPAPPIEPAYVALTVPFSVSELPPRLTLVPAEPASAPIACVPDALLTSNVAPAPVRFTVPVEARLPPAPTASVPLLIVVSPV